MDRLRNIVLFVEVAKHKSFIKASEVLEIPSSTISKKISELEDSIGIKLLNRVSRKLELTESGKLYYNRCNHLVDQVETVNDLVGEIMNKPKGLLRICAPADFSNLILTPLVMEFSQQYPELSFEFSSNPKRLDIISDNFDIAIHLGSMINTELISQKITTTTNALYATPEYIKQNSQPKNPEDLINHQCLKISSFNNETDNYLVLSKDKETIKTQVTQKFFVNDLTMLKQIILSNSGIGVIDQLLVAKELAENKLVRVLPEWHVKNTPIYALTKPGLQPVKCKLFIQFLMDKLKAI